jgi:hypothetical protein
VTAIRLLPQQPPDDTPAAVAVAAPDADPRAQAVTALCARFAAVCESAVDPLEICSALEFEGMNDRAVRDLYGLPDVFALAEEMYRRVPRRPAEPEPQPEAWPSGVLRPALHGMLYGVPTVFFPAATRLLTGRGVLTMLVVALLTSWGLSQSLAYVGYLRLGRAGRAQASRLLRFGMAAGMVAAAAVLVSVTMATSAYVPALPFGLGLAAYMLGATVLMVLGAEPLLLIALAPGVLGAVVFLLLGRPAQLAYATWGMLALTPLLALGLAASRTTREAGLPRLFRRGRTGPVPATGKLLRRPELLGALPSGAFGLLAAGLLVFPIATARGGTDKGALLASLPLSLSMGVAEWTLVWFRRRTQWLLRDTREPRAFAIRARLALGVALLGYLAAAAALTAIVAAVAADRHLMYLNRADLPQVLAYLALGGAMFVALLLQAFSSRIFPLIACAVALAAEIACRGLGAPAEFWAYTGLLAVLAGCAALILGNAVRHAL